MEKTGSIERFNRLLLDERASWFEIQKSPDAMSLAETRLDIRDHLRDVGKSGDIGLILATEKAILVTDFTLYANSPAMSGSLRTALHELVAAEKLLPKVADPARYKAVDEDHSLGKNRKGGVPLDEARQFFRSHDTRLVNMDRSRLDDAEKAIIDERKRNVRVAEKVYTAVQLKVLGLTPAQEHGQGMSL